MCAPTHQHVPLCVDGICVQVYSVPLGTLAPFLMLPHIVGLPELTAAVKTEKTSLC